MLLFLKPGTDDFELVPKSKLVVTRTAFKDNTSFYTVNGQRLQFKEVAKLLRSHGIDLDHNRFLILQGEVEQIAMMKRKAPNEHESGMLEFLEDIIGTTRYKVSIGMRFCGGELYKYEVERTYSHNTLITKHVYKKNVWLF